MVVAPLPFSEPLAAHHYHHCLVEQLSQLAEVELWPAIFLQAHHYHPNQVVRAFYWRQLVNSSTPYLVLKQAQKYLHPIHQSQASLVFLQRSYLELWMCFSFKSRHRQSHPNRQVVLLSQPEAPFSSLALSKVSFQQHFQGRHHRQTNLHQL